MGLVENMVCPDCVRQHGRAHAAGCPRDIPEAGPAYVAGWNAARNAFGLMAKWAAEDERRKLDEAFAAFAEIWLKREGP